MGQDNIHKLRDKSIGKHPVWLGATWARHSFKWNNLNKTLVTKGFQFWSYGEPDIYGGYGNSKNCMTMHFRGLWNCEKCLTCRKTNSDMVTSTGSLTLRREFNELLKDSKSLQFQLLELIVKAELLKTFCTGTFATGCSVKIIRFRKGSVIVEFAVTIQGKQSDVKLHVASALTTLPTTIDRSVVTKKEITETKKTTTKCEDSKDFEAKCPNWVKQGECIKSKTFMKATAKSPAMNAQS